MHTLGAFRTWPRNLGWASIKSDFEEPLRSNQAESTEKTGLIPPFSDKETDPIHLHHVLISEAPHFKRLDKLKEWKFVVFYYRPLSADKGLFQMDIKLPDIEHVMS